MAKDAGFRATDDLNGDDNCDASDPLTGDTATKTHKRPGG